MNTITEQENKRREIEQEKRKAQAPEASKKEQERLAKEAEARKREADALARAMAEKERIQRSANESKSRAEDLKTLRKVDRTQTQDERTKVAFQTNARTVSEKNVAVNAMRNSLNPQQSVDLYRRILKDGERVPRGLRGGGNPWRQVKLSDDSRDKGPKTTTINTYSPPSERSSSADFPSFPFKLYISDNSIRFVDGVHVWWNSYIPEAVRQDVTDGGGWSIASRVIYVERQYNSDGTASVSVGTAADEATVYSGITTTVARWVIGVISSNGTIAQHQFGPISELRVA